MDADGALDREVPRQHVAPDSGLGRPVAMASKG
jgi:hypothetical protein